MNKRDVEMMLEGFIKKIDSRIEVTARVDDIKSGVMDVTFSLPRTPFFQIVSDIIDKEKSSMSKETPETEAELRLMLANRFEVVDVYVGRAASDVTVLPYSGKATFKVTVGCVAGSEKEAVAHIWKEVLRVNNESDIAWNDAIDTAARHLTHFKVKGDIEDEPYDVGLKDGQNRLVVEFAEYLQSKLKR